MSDTDIYYQILGLNPGASEEEIKEAYKDLIKVWHPDRFSNDPRLKEKANEKLREINLAYKVLKAYIAGKSEQATASRERGNHAESQPTPREPSPKPDEEQTTAGVEGYDGFQPPPQQAFGQPPPHVSPIRQEKQNISYLPLGFFFGVIGGAIGKSITNFIHFSPDEAFIYGGGIPTILGVVGMLIGIGIVKIINGMEKPRKHKVRLAWGAAVVGGLLFPLTSWFILSPFLEHKQARTSSSPRQLSSTRPPPEKEKRPDWMTDDLIRSIESMPPPPPPSSGKLNPLFADIDKTPPTKSWRVLSYRRDDDSTYSYDPASITRPSENIAKVWTKMVYGNKSIIEVIGQLGAKYKDARVSVDLSELNCSNKMVRSLSLTYYNIDGSVLGSSDVGSFNISKDWNFIVPNTGFDLVFQEVCR